MFRFFLVYSLIRDSSNFSAYCTRFLRGGNISIFAGDRGGKFNAYGYFLRESPIIVGIELYLLFALLCHVLVAMWITLREGKCTLASTLKSGYKNTWAKTRLAITGTCILVFLVVHLFDFRFGKEYDAALPLISMKKNPWHRYFGGEEYISRVRDLYRIQKETMSDPKHVVFYIFSCYAIASHLKSGFLRTNVKVVPKEHRKLAAWIIPLCFDIMMGTFALIPIATYFDYV